MIAKSRLDWLILRARRQIWFRAAIIAVAGMVVAGLAGPVAQFIPYEFTGDIGQDSAGTVLQIIASSMLAVTTFSLTAMVSAYSSATQLGTPRATQLMLSDRTSQNALSTFLGAFIFAIVGLIGLQTRLYGGQGRVVLLIATVLLIVLVVATLLRWIAHLASFGRMADVIDRVENAACDAMTAFADDPWAGGRAAVPVPDDATAIASEEIGYVTHVDVAALGRIAERHALVVHVAARPGALVHADRPLMHVEGDASSAMCDALRRAFTIERHRSFDHDPRLGVIALAEIAARALAPATNDPGTAIEVLNALLRTLSRLPPDKPDVIERPRVHLPRLGTEELIRAGFHPIVREGAGEEEVATRTLKILMALRSAVPSARSTVDALVAELRDNIERVMPDGAARDRVLALCRECGGTFGPSGIGDRHDLIFALPRRQGDPAQVADARCA